MMISVIIPTYNREKAALDVLKTLAVQTYRDFEVVVVDQSDSPSAAMRAMSNVKYIYTDIPSLPRARNIGAKNSTGDITLFIDDDVIPDNALLMEHARSHEDASVDGVGGRVIGAYDRATTGNVGQLRFIDAKIIRNFQSENIVSGVSHLPGGNMSFKRRVFDKFGYFDELYGGRHSMGEETDFCMRIVEGGGKLVFNGKASLLHLHIPAGGCREDTFASWLFYSAHNLALFSERHIPARYLPLIFFQRLARFSIFSLEKGDLSAPVVGACGFLKGIKTGIHGRK